ncbi:MAG: ABC transporter permease [Caldilineaceae bacterium]|nr:ABC transporter permease [Caldilineaceae bacterium]HRJ40671.1 ABC transporter permease [Caldilineaceae bacterium]
MKTNSRLRIGLTILAIFALGSLILPFFNEIDPTRQGSYPKNMAVSFEHLLGTNSLGQDIGWFLVYAVRNSLILGVTVSIFTTFIAGLAGLVAGYLGGWADRAIMTLTDSVIAIPLFPILIVLATLVRGNTSFWTVGVILVIFGWAWGARQVRSMALSIREREFISMAKFSGSTTLEVVFKEIFPYVYAYMVVGFINAILWVINTEAGLAVIGLSKVEVPTLGSIIFWALSYNALFTGQYVWIIAPVVATVLLFLGLFLTSTGYNELYAARRGHSS